MNASLSSPDQGVVWLTSVSADSAMWSRELAITLVTLGEQSGSYRVITFDARGSSLYGDIAFS